MKIQFNSDLDDRQEDIASIVDIFQGQAVFRTRRFRKTRTGGER